MNLEDRTRLEILVKGIQESVQKNAAIDLESLHRLQKQVPAHALVLDCVERATASETSEIRKRVHDEFFECGPLETLLDDHGLTEIIINSWSSIWIEKSGQLFSHHDWFLSQLTHSNFISKICLESRMNCTLEMPFGNARWREFRVHLAIPPISSTQSMTLRRHPQNRWTLPSLSHSGMLTDDQCRILMDAVQKRENLLVVGPTGCGKTSLLDACLALIGSQERAVIIEDTDELACPNFASTKLLTRPSVVAQLREITQTDLVKESLRMRPDRLIMGEVRGPEAKDLLLALATGHTGSICTLHARTAQQALLRLEILVQLGAPQWSLLTVRQLIRLSLDKIIVVGRKNIQRQVLGIFSLTSLEECGFLLDQVG